LTLPPGAPSGQALFGQLNALSTPRRGTGVRAPYVRVHFCPPLRSWPPCVVARTCLSICPGTFLSPRPKKPWRGSGYIFVPASCGECASPYVRVHFCPPPSVLASLRLPYILKAPWPDWSGPALCLRLTRVQSPAEPSQPVPGGGGGGAGLTAPGRRLRDSSERARHESLRPRKTIAKFAISLTTPPNPPLAYPAKLLFFGRGHFCPQVLNFDAAGT